MSATSPTTLVTLTARSAAIAGAIGRISSASRQPPSASCALDDEERRASSATTMTPKSTTSISSGLVVFQRTSWSTTPSPTAATNATGIDSMRATTAAASAGSSTAGPAIAEGVAPRNGARSTKVRAASAPARTHTTVVRLRTGTPSSRARSVFSAAARIAVPASEPRRNQASAPTTSGTTAATSRWSPLMTTGPSSKLVEVSGVSNAPSSGDSTPNTRRGIPSSRPPRSWARPMVATVSTSRGAWAKRRITTTSTRPPSTAPPTSAIAMATG